jgi:hypothetical protein
LAIAATQRDEAADDRLRADEHGEIDTCSSQETTVTKDEAARLTRENERLTKDNADMKRRLEALEKGHHDRVSKDDRPTDRGGDPRRHARGGDRGGADVAPSGGTSDRSGREGTGPQGTAPTRAPFLWTEQEPIYQAFKTRLISEASSDPQLLRVLLERPELEVKVARRTVTADASELSGRVALLIADGWFDDGKGATATATEMKRRGWDHDYRNVAKACDRLTSDGFFTREDGAYVAVPGMKVRVIEA